jgi:hypothetical protein
MTSPWFGDRSAFGLAATAAEKRRNIEIVVAFVEHGFWKARANRADTDRALFSLGRTVTVPFLDR